MLSTSRTALRAAANKKFTVKAGVRAVSAWSNVPQGPPVSQLRKRRNSCYADTIAGCMSSKYAEPEMNTAHR